MDDLEYIKKYILENETSLFNLKKQNGEVFTPFEIIDKMLNTLDDKYFKEYNESIFNNKDLKWMDNSSGIGNFIIVIYYKLNIGLKNIIKNKNIRNYLVSDEFQDILSSCSWGNYRIDWRLFTYFKKNFWIK